MKRSKSLVGHINLALMCLVGDKCGCAHKETILPMIWWFIIVVTHANTLWPNVVQVSLRGR